MLVTWAIFFTPIIWAVNAAQESCFQSGQGYAGNDIKHVQSSTSPADCQRLCQEIATCVVWTFDTRSRHRWTPASYKHRGCWLHHGRGRQIYDGDFTSGPQYCPTSAPTTTTTIGTTQGPTIAPEYVACYASNTDYPGADMSHLTNINGPVECQKECQQYWSCAFWTFYGEKSSPHYGCWLKNKQNTPVTKDKCISGPAKCPDCLEQDTAYPGNDIGSYTSPNSAAECQIACQNRAGCNVWTYSPPHIRSNGKSACYMKKGKGRQVQKTDKISGPKNCTAPGPTPAPEPSPTTAAPVEGLGLGVRCQSYKGPPCAEPNSACITYRCKCVDEWVRYPRSGNACIAQNTLELLTPCTTPGSRCSAENSECRAFRCFCKLGFTMSAAGDECIPPLVG